MTNVTVVFEYEEPEYCRLCLSKETEGNDLSMIQSDTVGIIQELLQIQLDKTDSDAFICSTCVESLEEFYSYRTRCRRNNVTLQKKAEERKQQQIELAKSAIANANVLDQVKDGESRVRVVIRMSAEGKASVRLQVQSKPSEAKEEKPAAEVEDAEAISEEPGTSTSSSTPSTSKANIPATEKPASTTGKKLIRLPMQPFYFYKTVGRYTNGYGLIYGGYRYCASVPRKQHIYWMCEQRKTHRCQAVILVNKIYTEFMLNCGHNHDPPQVKRGQKIFKAADVLPYVMKSERMREERLKEEGISILERKTYSKSSKQEDYTSEEEEDDDDDEDEGEEYSSGDDEPMESEEEAKQDGKGGKREEKSTETPTSPVAIKKEQVDDGDECMYIIKELT